jgi:Phage tail tube protein, GTA-gp10
MTMTGQLPNIHRGEVVATLDGVQKKLRLTLNVLAELEDAFGVDSLFGLIQKLTTTKLTARHLMMIIAAGLRGAGEPVDADSVGKMHCERGPAGFADLARELLEASFGIEGGEPGQDPKPKAAPGPVRKAKVKQVEAPPMR